MPQKNIFPTESIDFSEEYHLAENTVKSQVIYSVIVLSVIAFLLSLPYIYVDITMQADGLIRPKSEKTEIKTITSGIVTNIFISEGQEVRKGDTLLTLRDNNVKSKIELTEFQINQNREFIHDLKQLIQQQHIAQLKTAFYRQSYIEYQQKVNEIDNRLQKAKKEFVRNKSLYEHEIIPEKEFDDFRYNLEIVENELKTYKEGVLNSRQNDLSQRKIELEQYASQLVQYQQEETNFIIKAPVTGTIEEFSGIYIGSNLQNGQTLATISPQSEIIAEIYANPKDIGFLSVGNKANIQVYAFNYNDWGMMPARITEISSDYMITEGKAYFRIRCELEKTHLQLKTGVKRKLKKGMTIRSRFIITERSLWQLLFDNLNDWLNPAMT